jgi:hypothetical protein
VFTHSLRDDILTHIDGTPPGALTPYCGLIKGITDFRAGTVTEAAYTGYGTRPSISFGAIANTTPTGGRQIANDTAVTFPQNTGTAEDQIAFGVYTAATAGTLKAIGFLDADAPIWCVVTDTTNDYFETAGDHGLALDQRVLLLAAPGAPIPTGVTENTAYYVGTKGVAPSYVTLSTTASNGNPVAVTAEGGCFLMPYTAVTVAQNATPEFAIGALVIQI